MAITYNAGTNTITVTGYTEATPCTFLDIYNADVAGGWGVVFLQSNTQFFVNAKLIIGDGSTATWFADESTHFLMKENLFSAHNGYLIHILNHAHFRLGKLISSTSKTTRWGCDFLVYSTGGVNWTIWLIYAENGAEVELYGCHVSDLITDGYKIIQGGNGVTKIYNCILDHVSLRYFSNIDAYNIQIQWASLGFQSLSGTLNKLSHINSRIYAVTLYGVPASMKNVYVRNSEEWDIRAGASSGNMYLINPDFDNWNIRFLTSPYPTIYRQYEFNLKVIDKDENEINGATIKIWDKDDNLVVDTTTNANGAIATQTLNYGYYNQAGGDTPTMQTPHTIQISKAGYETYKKKWTIDEKIDWRIRLLQANPVQFLDDNPILRLCPESQEDDRILFGVI